MIDALAALITYLENEATLTAHTTAAYIYGPDGIPSAREGGPSMPRKALVVLESGVSAPPSTENVELSMRFAGHCYGATQVEAMDVFRALADVLHGTKRKDVDVGVGVGSGAAYNNRMLIARLVGGPRRSQEPLTEWPRVIGEFEAMFVRDELDTY